MVLFQNWKFVELLDFALSSPLRICSYSPHFIMNDCGWLEISCRCAIACVFHWHMCKQVRSLKYLEDILSFGTDMITNYNFL